MEENVYEWKNIFDHVYTYRLCDDALQPFCFLAEYDHSIDHRPYSVWL